MGWLKKIFGKDNNQKGRRNTAPVEAEKELLVSNRKNSTPVTKNLTISEKSKKSRSIRVFISSTFQDMQEERDVLVKKIFPQLRKICMDRGVGFTEVDLRWGVTED